MGNSLGTNGSVPGLEASVITTCMLAIADNTLNNPKICAKTMSSLPRKSDAFDPRGGIFLGQNTWLCLESRAIFFEKSAYKLKIPDPLIQKSTKIISKLSKLLSKRPLQPPPTSKWIKWTFSIRASIILLQRLPRWSAHRGPRRPRILRW